MSPCDLKNKRQRAAHSTKIICTFAAQELLSNSCKVTGKRRWVRGRPLVLEFRNSLSGLFLQMQGGILDFVG